MLEPQRCPDESKNLCPLNYVQEVQNGNFSAEDFVSSTLERIHNIDEKLHAFLSVNDRCSKSSKTNR